MVDGRIHFFTACWTVGLSSLMNVASRLPWVLSLEQLKTVGFPRASKQEGKRENKLAGQKSVSCDLLLEVTSHHFCRTLVISSVVQPTVQEREFHKNTYTRKWGPWEPS